MFYTHYNIGVLVDELDKFLETPKTTPEAPKQQTTGCTERPPSQNGIKGLKGESNSLHDKGGNHPLFVLVLVIQVFQNHSYNLYDSNYERAESK